MDLAPLLTAHAGHWAIWALYAVPIVVVLVSIFVSMIRSRRERAGSGETDRGTDPDARADAR